MTDTTFSAFVLQLLQDLYDRADEAGALDDVAEKLRAEVDGYPMLSQFSPATSTIERKHNEFKVKILVPLLLSERYGAQLHLDFVIHEFHCALDIAHCLYSFPDECGWSSTSAIPVTHAEDMEIQRVELVASDTLGATIGKAILDHLRLLAADVQTEAQELFGASADRTLLAQVARSVILPPALR